MLSHVLFFFLSFSFILFCVFSLDIFDTDFWSSCLTVSREVASLMEKLKFTALATRASGTSVPLSSSSFFYYLAWAWLTDVPMPPSVVLCVRLHSGGKICNLSKLELT